MGNQARSHVLKLTPTVNEELQPDPDATLLLISGPFPVSPRGLI